MKIGEFSKKSGFTIDTLRYYDKIGLLCPKRINNTRNYNALELETSEIIGSLKTLNFTISDMIKIINLDKQIDENMKFNFKSREKIEEIAEILDEKYKFAQQQCEIFINTMDHMKKMKEKTNALLKYGVLFSNQEDLAMLNYKSTIKFWDGLFNNMDSIAKSYDLPKEIEDGFKWLSNGSDTILDFGCGTGKGIFRCIDYGVKKAIGIDSSKEAVSLCSRSSEKLHLGDKTEFICGDFGYLKEIKGGSIDSIILFNILDNILPADMLGLLSECRRILKPGGKALVKLNPYLQNQEEIPQLKKLSNILYIDENGLFLNNISDEYLEDTVNVYFSIKKTVKINLNDAIHRLFYLERG
ncbi:MerR family transcriptional regulator [Clostridium akagii]|uniref:MerR family transcriptional regulator n=1 Tax=Clostridium akagii TaxID=91623 RepID=UPI00047A3FC9|nr:MerR family transcriptional regulator [Clostridium akagii]